eukprot:scaffold4959_cov162-Alexandrium_tamarense.AAC.1
MTTRSTRKNTEAPTVIARQLLAELAERKEKARVFDVCLNNMRPKQTQLSKGDTCIPQRSKTSKKKL